MPGGLGMLIQPDGDQSCCPVWQTLDLCGRPVWLCHNWASFPLKTESKKIPILLPATSRKFVSEPPDNRMHPGAELLI